MKGRLHAVYEAIEYDGKRHYGCITDDEEGRSNLKRLNVRYYRIVDGGAGLDLERAQAMAWEKSEGRELPDLLEE